MEEQDRGVDPHQAWQSVLDQLEKDMPKASFSTWVRETWVERCDDRTLTVGGANAYGRDWLESHLTGTVNDILQGLMHRPMSVRFVVAEAPAEGDQEEDAGINRRQATEGEGLTIEVAEAATRYAQEVQPERVVAPYAYAFRLIHFGDITPKQFSLWIGFRQAVYTLWRRGGGTVKNIPWQDVCRFAMMARASFFREIKDLSLPGLVQQIEIPKEKQHYRDRAGRVHQRANLYRVYMHPPLAQADAASLLQMLRARSKIEPGMAAPERTERAAAALDSLSKENVADILAKLPEGSEPIPPIEERQGATVPDLVRRLIGIEDLPEALQTAAEDLHQRIISAFGTAHVTHYFLEKVAPALGLSHAQAWLIAQLRDRCFEDPESGEVRDWVLVPGGYRTLSRWAGVSPRRKTIYEWLRLENFASLVAEIRPNLDEPEILANNLLDDARRLLDTWAERDIRVLAVCLKEPLVVQYADETPVGTELRLSEYDDETRRGYADETPVGTQVRLTWYGHETHFKLFKALHKTPKTQINSSTGGRGQNENQSQVQQGAVNLPVAWVLDRILIQNKVHPKVQKAIRGGDAKALISWILYGVSFGARKPLSYALSRFAEDPLSGAGDDFDRLAALPPAQLVGMIEGAAHSRTDPEWLAVVGPIGKLEASGLLRVLLGDKAPIRISHETHTESLQFLPDGSARRTIHHLIDEP